VNPLVVFETVQESTLEIFVDTPFEIDLKSRINVDYFKAMSSIEIDEFCGIDWPVAANIGAVD
jgi:adenylylsulfate kinase-like enzyme